MADLNRMVHRIVRNAMEPREKPSKPQV